MFHLNDSINLEQYRYNEELAGYSKEQHTTTTTEAPSWLGDFLSWIFREEHLRFLLPAIAIVLLVFIAIRLQWIEALKRYFRAQPVVALSLDQICADTDIYAHDLPAEIAKATEDGDRHSLVKYLYLSALRHLVESSILEWKPAKTPSDYVYDLLHNARPEHDNMQQLTLVYLRVYYGHYPADAAIETECLRLHNGIVLCRKGGEA